MECQGLAYAIPNNFEQESTTNRIKHQASIIPQKCPSVKFMPHLLTLELLHSIVPTLLASFLV